MISILTENLKLVSWTIKDKCTEPCLNFTYVICLILYYIISYFVIFILLMLISLKQIRQLRPIIRTMHVVGFHEFSYNYFWGSSEVYGVSEELHESVLFLSSPHETTRQVGGGRCYYSV